MTAIDLVALDATEQAARVRSRTITARQLVEAALARIDEIDPLVNAFRIVMRKEALDVERWGRFSVWESGSVRVTYFHDALTDDDFDTTFTELMGEPVATGGYPLAGEVDPPPHPPRATTSSTAESAALRSD